MKERRLTSPSLARVTCVFSDPGGSAFSRGVLRDGRAHRRAITGLVVAALIAGVGSVPAPARAARTCFGKAATIVGTNTDPRKPVKLNGTPGDDVIVGLKGWDIINGRGGDDLICSGGGDDYVKAGGGDDKVKAAGGLDTVNGDRGKDSVWGGPDVSDSLLGGPGADRLFGGAGSGDSLVGGPGGDLLNGGEGYDTAEFWDSPTGIVADLRSGDAVGHGHDRMVGIEGLTGSNHNDMLFGDDLSNQIQAGGGDDHVETFGSTDGSYDILRSGGGTDTLDGGEGWDMVSYNISPYPVEADLATGEAISAFGFGHDTLIDIEHLVGSKEDDVLYGDDGDNAIIGNRGNDVLDGRGGTDEAAFFDTPLSITVNFVEGTAVAVGWGSDTLTNFENTQGSGYADILIGDDGPNLIWGNPGRDSLQGLGGDDELIGDAGVDEADGGDDSDVCDAETEVNCEIDPSAQSALVQPLLGWEANPWSGL